MKTLILLFLLSLGGCKSIEYVYVPVYTPIEIQMPVRPVLSSVGGTSYDVIGKNIENDLIDLKSYAMQLELLLNDISIKQGQKIKINK